MKKILALILSLILCFSFIVSCSKEKEASNESANSNEELTFGKQAQKDNINVDVGAKLSFSTIDKKYTTYKLYCIWNQDYGLFEHWFFTNYEDYDVFVRGNTYYVCEEITEETFENYVVLVVFVPGEEGDVHISKAYGDVYADEKNENSYILVFERSRRVNPVYDTISYPDDMDIVLIPKEDIENVENLSDINLEVRTHFYEQQIEIFDNPYEQ